MAKLPDFNALGPRPIPTGANGPIATYDATKIGNALATAGEGIGKTASFIGAQIQQKEDQLARQNAALAEARYKNFVAEKSQDVDLSVRNGEILAQKLLDERLAAIGLEGRKTFFSGIDQKYLPSLQVAAEGTDITTRGLLREQLYSAQQFHQKAGLEDLIAEKMRNPGDLEETAREIEYTRRAMGPSAGIDAATLQKQIADDYQSLYFNDFKRRLQDGSEDLVSLDRLEHHLLAEDGEYKGLSTENKLNGRAAVLVQRQQLVAKQAQEQTRLETKASSVVKDFGDRISTGVPIPAEELEAVRPVFESLGREDQLTQLALNEQTIQAKLREPDAQIDDFLQRQDTLQLQKGATKEERENLQRMKTAFTESKKQRSEDPLLWAQTRTSLPVPELDLSKLGTPEGEADIRAVLREREISTDAMRQQYGPGVPRRLLKTQDVELLSTQLDASSAPQQLNTLKSLARSSKDFTQFQRVVSQLAPGNPVRANAALLAGATSLPPLQTGGFWWFKDYDRSSANQVAERILLGDAAINPVERVGEDGKVKREKIPLPEYAEGTNLDADFAEHVKDAFAGDSVAYQNARQTFLAYYAGKSIQTKGNAREYDEKIKTEALDRAVGTVSVTNDGRRVVTPWGMTGSQFRDSTRESFDAFSRAHGLTENQVAQYDDAGLVGVGLNRYAVSIGDALMIAPDGQPVVLDLSVKPGAQGLLDTVMPILPYGREQKQQSSGVGLISSMLSTDGQALAQDTGAAKPATAQIPQIEQAAVKKQLGPYTSSMPISSEERNRQFLVTALDATKEESKKLSEFRDKWKPAELASAEKSRGLVEEVLVASQSGLQFEPSDELPNIKHSDPRLSVLAKEVEAKVGLVPGFLDQIRLSGERSQSRGGAGKSISKDGAAGVYQFIPSTGREYGLYDYMNPVLSTVAAARFGLWLQNKYDGNIAAMLAHYNKGHQQAELVMQGKQPTSPEAALYLWNTLRGWFSVDPSMAESTGAYRLPAKKPGKK